MSKSPIKIIILLFSLSLASPAFAGSGYYLGADYVRNSFKEITKTNFGTVTISQEKQDKTNDYGFRFGYKHKIHKYAYISPEFFYNSVDSSEYLYSTNIKAGVEVKNLSLFASLGYAEIKAFDGSSENFGGGIEYKINDNFSISSEYLKFDDVKTSQTDSSSTANKRSKLEQFKFGLTYYFHE